MKKYILGMLLGLFPCSLMAEDFIPVEMEINEPVLIPEKQGIRIDYTWGDFLMGKSCQEDLKLLEERPFLDKRERDLKIALKRYCSGEIVAWQNLLTVFRQSKKNLLFSKIEKENPSFLKYFKIIPLFLLDVHHVQPEGDSLCAKLDRIQNAIQDKNPHLILLLMQDLSPNEQIFLMPVFNEASSLVDFERILKGESHD